MTGVHAAVCYQHSSPIKCSTFIAYDGRSVLAIDISGQRHKTLPHVVIRNRCTLVHLIADRNLLNENAFNMPLFPRLRTLSIDVNRIRDVSTLLINLRRACPQLSSLSLIGNPGWSPSVCNKSQQLYKEHRKAAVAMLPHLCSIDARTTANSRRS